MRFLIALIVVLGTACNDHNLLATADGTPLRPGDDDSQPGDPDDDDASGGPYDDPDPWIDECPPEALRPDFTGGDGAQAYVKSWERTRDGATLHVPTAGVYAVYNTELAESGESQRNETAYFRFPGSGLDGASEVTNCGDEYVVQDADNEGASPGHVLVGVFALHEGPNELEMHHFCPLFRAGACPSFHVGDPEAPGGCRDGNPNSVHFEGSGICLVPLNP